MYREEVRESFDGTSIFTRVDESLQEAKGVVVIQHGLAEHLNRYDRLTRALTQAGFHVYRYDQRGHGRSGGKRVFYHDYSEILEDGHGIVVWAQAENPGLPVFMVGHSMGGYGAALLGTKYPKLLKGLILSGALTRYTKPTFGVFPMEGDPNIYLPNALGKGVCSDPKVGAEYSADPLVGKEISLGLMQSLEAGLVYLQEKATDFVDPVLILHGINDGLVSEEDSRKFFTEIGSVDRTLHIYAYLEHEIFNEPCQQEIFAEVLNWLEKHC